VAEVAPANPCRIAWVALLRSPERISRIARRIVSVIVRMHGILFE
jgi:hypothetical protein